MKEKPAVPSSAEIRAYLRKVALEEALPALIEIANDKTHKDHARARKWLRARGFWRGDEE